MAGSSTVQEGLTSLPPTEVLARAKTFFTRRNSIYAAFLEKEGERFALFRGQGGEEIALAVDETAGGGTRVTASTYLFDMQIGRFLATLPPPAAPSPVAGNLP